MADIFISYAREDRETAQSLAQVLEDKGCSVWWDTRLKAGEIWDEMIERELTAARSVVVLWSTQSVNSRWVRKEARYGDAHGMLFPALIEMVNIPLEFADVHAVDLKEWTGEPSHLGLRDLIRALMISLGEPSPPSLQISEPVPSKESPKPGAEPDQLQSSRSTFAEEPLQPEPAAKKRSPADLPDLAVFRDIDEPWCPEMVALPAGEFVMGASLNLVSKFATWVFDTGPGRHGLPLETPPHMVCLHYRFAVGRYPVTVAEYSRFIDVTGRIDHGGFWNYRRMTWWGSLWSASGAKRGELVKDGEMMDWKRPGFAQTDLHPVVCVSWDDANAYVEWLSKETGAKYRLLSEAEWEYACRAGTTTTFSFGDSITERDANFGLKLEQTTEVGSYPENPWGLCDMHGNVWEWVEDIWHDNYTGAPIDGSAWKSGGYGRRRVVRGGSWIYLETFRDPDSSYRAGFHRDSRSISAGFRIARTIER